MNSDLLCIQVPLQLSSLSLHVHVIFNRTYLHVWSGAIRLFLHEPQMQLKTTRFLANNVILCMTCCPEKQAPLQLLSWLALIGVMMQANLMLKMALAVWKPGPQIWIGLARQLSSKQSGISGAWDKAQVTSCRMLKTPLAGHQMCLKLTSPLQMAYCSLLNILLQAARSHNQLQATGSITSCLQVS